MAEGSTLHNSKSKEKIAPWIGDNGKKEHIQCEVIKLGEEAKVSIFFSNFS